MKLLFDDRALADLEAIHLWIGQDSPQAARALIDRIFAAPLIYALLTDLT